MFFPLLQVIQPQVCVTALDNDMYLTKTKMHLAIAAKAPQADIVNRPPKLVRICSAAHIEHLVRQALPGVPMKYVPSPPGAIPIKLNYQYFSLRQSGLAWEAVPRERKAYVPGDLPNPQLELIILLPHAG